MHDEVSNYLKQFGFEEDLVADGAFHHAGKNWYIAHDQGEGRVLITFGNFATNQRLTKKFGYKDGDESWRALQESQHKIKELAETDQVKALQKIIQTNFQSILSSSNTHPYLTSKGITNLYGAKVNGIELLVPMQDVVGRIWNVQKIWENGVKNFTPGAKTKGLMGFLGKDPKLMKHCKHIAICEGFATAVSIDKALEASGDTDYYVICAFTAKNLIEVAKNLKKKYPDKKFTIFGDNDHTKQINVGHDAAFEASLDIDAQLVVSPKESGVSDFNDLLQKHGMAHTLEVIEAQKDKPLSEVATASGTTVRRHITHYSDIEPLPVKYNEKGAPLAPDDYELAQYVLDYFDTKFGLMKHNQDLFIYREDYWNLCHQREIDTFRNTIMAAGGGKITQRKVGDVYRTFTGLITHMDRDPWTMNTELCNLANGVIEITGDKLTFREHRKSDLCIYKIPVNYEPDARNKLFEDTIAAMFAQDAQGPEKVLLLQEMYGACLFPKYPKIFLLYGKANRGKTTLIIPATRLVDHANLAFLGPHEFKDFHMENLVGKLVNVNTDIDTKKTIQDAVLKKIEDRIPVTMNRKGRAMVKAPMPALHIFGANELPKTTETSEAHERRWALINLDELVLPTNTVLDFGNKVFDAGSSGILNWALGGFQRLMDRGGKFTVTESGKASMEEWKLETDVVAQFISDIKEGSFTDLTIDPDGKVMKATMYLLFQKWFEEVHQMKTNMKRHEFFKSFGARFVDRRVTKGFAYFGVRLTKSDI